MEFLNDRRANADQMHFTFVSVYDQCWCSTEKFDATSPASSSSSLTIDGQTGQAPLLASGRKRHCGLGGGAASVRCLISAACRGTWRQTGASRFISNARRRALGGVHWKGSQGIETRTPCGTDSMRQQPHREKPFSPHTFLPSFSSSFLVILSLLSPFPLLAPSLL